MTEDYKRKYHHLGIPTDVPREKETYLPEYKMCLSGFDTSPFGIEWMRFDPDCQLPELVRTVPHIAFEVEDLEEEIRGKEVIISPNDPSPGVTVAFIVDNGAPVEFLQFKKDKAWHAKVQAKQKLGH